MSGVTLASFDFVRDSRSGLTNLRSTNRYEASAQASVTTTFSGNQSGLSRNAGVNTHSMKFCHR